MTQRGAARGKREREYWVHISFNTPTHPPGGQPSAHVFARELTGWRGYRVFEQALGLAEGHSPPHRLGEQEKNRAEQGLEWRARETRINRRFRSSREQGSNAAWLAFLGLPAARRMDDTYGRGHRNNTLREHDRGTQSTHSRGGYPLRHGRLLAR